MGALAGGVASFFSSFGASIEATAEATTQVGATNEYYISDRLKAVWDPTKAVVVYDGVDIIPNCHLHIDYVGGYVTLPAAPVGAVTVDCWFFFMEALAGGHEWSVDPTAEKLDCTTFPNELNTNVIWKAFVAGLLSWKGAVKRHWWYSKASLTVDCTLDNSDLVWTWGDAGEAGNDESVVYVVAGNNTPLSIARVANLTTVNIATDAGGVATSTAEDILNYIEGDALGILFEMSYPGVQDGSGVVNAKAEADLTGGRSSGEELGKLATKVVCVFYIDVTTGSIQKLEGVCNLIGVDVNAPVGELIEGDLSFEGIGKLCYHTV